MERSATVHRELSCSRSERSESHWREERRESLLEKWESGWEYLGKISTEMPYKKIQPGTSKIRKPK